MKCVINLFGKDEEYEIVVKDLDDDIIQNIEKICFTQDKCVEDFLKDMINDYFMKK